MAAKPTNIDILSIGRPCNQNCRQCYYIENSCSNLEIDHELLASKIMEKYAESSFFIYPKEIANNQELFELINKAGQQSVLSNGLLLDNDILDKLKEAEVKQIKITLFANADEQFFFNGNNSNQYEKIILAIKKCKEKGFNVVVNNVLSKKNIFSIGTLCKLCHGLGVDKIEFLRIKPTGNGRDLQGMLLCFDDMSHIIEQVEINKKLYPELYLSFNLSFGPNFYGKSLPEAEAKIKKSVLSWTKSNYLCPAIDGNYWGLSATTGNVYWCFFAMNEAFSKMGYYSSVENQVIINKAPDLSPSTLLKKLGGECSRDKCIYTDICLGGCRSTAYMFAKYKGEKDPLYAGMDICLTKCYERFYSVKSKKDNAIDNNHPIL